ncbi:hypothetical protein NESM_000884300 [Novymonas esmeraldas]|uniref:Uncharacterized protein n=1 Tax=Novymonas esmeraldas TaxID=1808958 RepID=A0AAW0F083_9TRYP
MDTDTRNSIIVTVVVSVSVVALAAILSALLAYYGTSLFCRCCAGRDREDATSAVEEVQQQQQQQQQPRERIRADESELERNPLDRADTTATAVDVDDGSCDGDTAQAPRGDEKAVHGAVEVYVPSELAGTDSSTPGGCSPRTGALHEVRADTPDQHAITPPPSSVFFDGAPASPSTAPVSVDIARVPVEGDNVSRLSSPSPAVTAERTSNADLPNTHTVS